MNSATFHPDGRVRVRAETVDQRTVDDLAMLIRKLVRQIRKTHPDNELAQGAVDYLVRKGLQGSPFREEPGS